MKNESNTKSGVCRFCKAELHHTFVDLGMSPLCESFLRPEQVNQMESFYPLHVFVCDQCFLVQLEEFVSPEKIFTEYAYFSSYSDSWLEHSRRYTEQMIERFHLNGKSLVVELASNDGYLLQYFVKKQRSGAGHRARGECGESRGRERNVPTLVKFFGEKLAKELAAEGKQADLLLGNNVLAQVPDLCDFVAGMKTLLKPQGVLTMEFPHLLQLIEGNQFDTIYHEHFSYFSFLTAERIFAAHGLVLFDVEELPTHGGSLRIYGRHREDTSKPVSARVLEPEGERGSGGAGASRQLPLLRGKGEEHQAPASGVPDPGQAAGQIHRRIWRSGKRQYAAELLRGGNRFSSTTPWIAIPTSTGNSLRELIFPSILRNGFAKPGRTTC